MPRRKSFQANEPLSLRTRDNAPTFTPNQLAVVGCFVSALLMGGNAAYVQARLSGAEIRLKIYAGDEAYADDIRPSDDLSALLGDYAAQFRVVDHYTAILGALHASRGRDAGQDRPGRATQVEATPK